MISLLSTFIEEVARPEGISIAFYMGLVYIAVMGVMLVILWKLLGKNITVKLLNIILSITYTLILLIYPKIVESSLVSASTAKLSSKLG